MSRLWMVRHGAHGEREQRALDEGLLLLGFTAVGDLGACENREAIEKVVTNALPDEAKKMRLAIWTGQLTMFRHSMAEGDLVIMPRKRSPQVAIGKVTGPYRYFLGALGSHTRKVDWLKNDVPRQVFAEDLRYSFGSAMTICRIARNNAVERVIAVVKLGSDPGWKISASGAAKSPSDTANEDQLESTELDTLARDQIRAHIASRFVGHEFTRLIGALLEAEGFRNNISSPGPDNGIDIVAGKGPLGFDPPRLVVQCKSGNQVCDLPTLNALIGSVHSLSADHGLLVSWGGFKISVQKQTNSQFFKIRLWDSDAVLDALFKAYDRLPEEIRKELPLKRTWMLVAPEESEA